MNSRRVSLVLVAVLVMAMSTSVLASSNPFSDVPAHHWAYDSVMKLAAVGLVEGYPDGTFGGTRTMTRYEAAMVFARALARLEALVESQVLENTAGVQERITADILAELDATVDELAKLIEDKLGIVVEETVKEEVAIQLKAAGPDLLLTAEAQAVLAQLVGDLVKEQLAEAKELATETIVETGVIERVVVEDVDEEVVRAIAEEVLANSLWAISEQVEANADFIDMTIAKINDRLGRLTTKVDQIGATYVSQEQLADELEALGDKMLDIEEEIAANADYVDMVFSKTNDRLGRVTRNVDLLASDVNTINGLIAALQGDVEALQASLIIETADLSDTFNKIRNEFSAELSLLGVRVGKLERLYQ
ncbi:MAG: S-layer homology domain-containing protein, partial [Limnochordia bacterium]